MKSSREEKEDEKKQCLEGGEEGQDRRREQGYEVRVEKTISAQKEENTFINIIIIVLWHPTQTRQM